MGLLYAHRRQFGNAFQEFGRDYVLASIDGAVASTSDAARARWESSELVVLREFDLPA